MYVIDNYYKLLSRVDLKSIKEAKKLIQADESDEVSINIHFWFCHLALVYLILSPWYW